MASLEQPRCEADLPVTNDVVDMGPSPPPNGTASHKDDTIEAANHNRMRELGNAALPPRQAGSHPLGSDPPWTTVWPKHSRVYPQGADTRRGMPTVPRYRVVAPARRKRRHPDPNWIPVRATTHELSPCDCLRKDKTSANARRDGRTERPRYPDSLLDDPAVVGAVHYPHQAQSGPRARPRAVQHAEFRWDDAGQKSTGPA